MNSDRSMPPGECAAPNPAYERRRYALASIRLVAGDCSVAAAPAGDAAVGVLREASEASGQEAEAEEGSLALVCFASAEGVQHPGMPLIFVLERRHVLRRTELDLAHVDARFHGGFRYWSGQHPSAENAGRDYERGCKQRKLTGQ